VRIGLVADVPDQPVAWRVEQIMQRDGKLDDAKASAQMAAGDRDRVNQLLPELGCELRELGLRKGAEILWRIDFVEDRRCGRPNNP
jgi:hypothetical protein